jgi:diaminopimelate decarboxylase
MTHGFSGLFGFLARTLRGEQERETPSKHLEEPLGTVRNPRNSLLVATVNSAAMHFVDGTLFIGEVSTAFLAEQHGTPLYVYDASVIRRQIARLTEAFAGMPLTPFYAIKANDNLAILRTMRDAGFGVDAVSPGEVHLARTAGIPTARMWFTCSNVSDEDLLALPDERIVVNVNSMSEIDRCVRLKLRNPIALRVNPEIGAGHHRDVVTGGFGVKFGLDLAEVEDARGTAEAGGLTIVGLHAHIGSGVTEVEPLLASARTLLGLIDEFPDLRVVNFGGGISVPYRPSEREFPLAEYGAGLTELAAERLHRRGLAAIIEPGRYLVAQSGILLARVTAKRISAGYEWIGLDTGFNHLARPSKYGAYHHIVNASRGSDEDFRSRSGAIDGGWSEVIVAGNICESGDVFTRDVEGPVPRVMPNTRQGDLLAITDTGAYGFSMASHYNARLLPAEVLVDGRDVTVIRQRQTYDELLRGQILAQRQSR